jgi:hypothetical protein
MFNTKFVYLHATAMAEQALIGVCDAALCCRCTTATLRPVLSAAQGTKWESGHLGFEGRRVLGCGEQQLSNIDRLAIGTRSAASATAAAPLVHGNMCMSC